MLYADSSFLASLYLIDTNTDQANKLLTKKQKPICLTVFNRVELRNSLRNMVARGEATSEIVAKAFALVESDLYEGFLLEKRLDTLKLFTVAEQLSNRYSEKTVVRCVDLLHVASAHVIQAESFLTFDSQQANFAKHTGLMVLP